MNPKQKNKESETETETVAQYCWVNIYTISLSLFTLSFRLFVCMYVCLFVCSLNAPKRNALAIWKFLQNITTGMCR